MGVTPARGQGMQAPRPPGPGAGSPSREPGLRQWVLPQRGLPRPGIPQRNLPRPGPPRGSLPQRELPRSFPLWWGLPQRDPPLADAALARDEDASAAGAARIGGACGQSASDREQGPTAPHAGSGRARAAAPARAWAPVFQSWLGGGWTCCLGWSWLAGGPRSR